MANRRYALSALVLGAASAGLVPRGPGLLVGAVLAALGLAASLRCRHEAEQRREEADALLADVPGSRVPTAVEWRAEELTDARARRVLARTLRRLVRDAEGPPALMLLPTNRRAVRANRAVIDDLATRLAELDRPIHPCGVARLTLLLTRSGSPLYDAEGADAVRRELVLARATIDPRR